MNDHLITDFDQLVPNVLGGRNRLTDYEPRQRKQENNHTIHNFLSMLRVAFE
jgi:hypothetical protein